MTQTDTTMTRDQMIDMELLELRNTLEGIWCKETSAGGYCPSRPSTGQCAITALLVQDLFGGELVRVVNTGESHYFNRIDGRDVDLTRDQFRVWSPSEEAERTREYLLSGGWTRTRYEILAARYHATR